MSGVAGIKIIVRGATRLPAKELFGKSDPFVRVTLGNHKHETSPQTNTTDPVWEESFTFKPESDTHAVFEVFDKDNIETDCIGLAVVDISTLALPAQQNLVLSRGGRLLVAFEEWIPSATPLVGLATSCRLLLTVLSFKEHPKIAPHIRLYCQVGIGSNKQLSTFRAAPFEWNDEFEFSIRRVDGTFVTVFVFEQDSGHHSDVVGMARFDLSDLGLGDGPVKCEIPLYKNNTQTCTLVCKVDVIVGEGDMTLNQAISSPKDALPSSPTPSSPGSLVLRYVRVSVKNGNDLMVDPNKCYVCCELTLGAKTCSTRAVRGSINPVWGETFIFPCHSEEDCLLHTSIYDKGQSGNVGSAVVNVAELGILQPNQEPVEIEVPLLQSRNMAAGQLVMFISAEYQTTRGENSPGRQSRSPTPTPPRGNNFIGGVVSPSRPRPPPSPIPPSRKKPLPDDPMTQTYPPNRTMEPLDDQRQSTNVDPDLLEALRKRKTSSSLTPKQTPPHPSTEKPTTLPSPLPSPSSLSETGWGTNEKSSELLTASSRYSSSSSSNSSSSRSSSPSSGSEKPARSTGSHSSRSRTSSRKASPQLSLKGRSQLNASPVPTSQAKSKSKTLQVDVLKATFPDEVDEPVAIELVVGASTRRTAVCPDSRRPTWNETFTFQLRLDPGATMSITLLGPHNKVIANNNVHVLDWFLGNISNHVSVSKDIQLYSTGPSNSVAAIVSLNLELSSSRIYRGAPSNVVDSVTKRRTQGNSNSKEKPNLPTRLHIQLKEAQELVSVNNRTDPFFFVELVTGNTKKQTKRVSTICKGYDPTWDESYLFNIASEADLQLMVIVCNKSEDEVNEIGFANVDLNTWQLSASQPAKHWVPLQSNGRRSGKVLLCVEAIFEVAPVPTSPSGKRPLHPSKPIKRGPNLLIIVHTLRRMQMQLTEAFLELSLGPAAQRTQSVACNPVPVWEEMLEMSNPADSRLFLKASLYEKTHRGAELIGTCGVDLSSWHIKIGTAIQRWIPLMHCGNKVAEVHLSVEESPTPAEHPTPHRSPERRSQSTPLRRSTTPVPRPSSRNSRSTTPTSEHNGSYRNGRRSVSPSLSDSIRSRSSSRDRSGPRYLQPTRSSQIHHRSYQPTSPSPRKSFLSESEREEAQRRLCSPKKLFREYDEEFDIGPVSPKLSPTERKETVQRLLTPKSDTTRLSPPPDHSNVRTTYPKLTNNALKESVKRLSRPRLSGRDIYDEKIQQEKSFEIVNRNSPPRGKPDMNFKVEDRGKFVEVPRNSVRRTPQKTRCNSLSNNKLDDVFRHLQTTHTHSSMRATGRGQTIPQSMHYGGDEDAEQEQRFSPVSHIARDAERELVERLAQPREIRQPELPQDNVLSVRDEKELVRRLARPYQQKEPFVPSTLKTDYRKLTPYEMNRFVDRMYEKPMRSREFRAQQRHREYGQEDMD